MCFLIVVTLDAFPGAAILEPVPKFIFKSLKKNTFSVRTPERYPRTLWDRPGEFELERAGAHQPGGEGVGDFDSKIA